MFKIFKTFYLPFLGPLDGEPSSIGIAPIKLSFKGSLASVFHDLGRINHTWPFCWGPSELAEKIYVIKIKC